MRIADEEALAQQQMSASMNGDKESERQAAREREAVQEARRRLRSILEHLTKTFQGRVPSSAEAAATLAADTLLMHAFAVVGNVHGFHYVEAFARQWLEMEEGDRQ
jgi:exonuclease VII large subunit